MEMYYLSLSLFLTQYIGYDRSIDNWWWPYIVVVMVVAWCRSSPFPSYFTYRSNSVKLPIINLTVYTHKAKTYWSYGYIHRSSSLVVTKKKRPKFELQYRLVAMKLILCKQPIVLPYTISIRWVALTWHCIICTVYTRETNINSYKAFCVEWNFIKRKQWAASRRGEQGPNERTAI